MHMFGCFQDCQYQILGTKVMTIRISLEKQKKCTVWLYMMERRTYNIAELRILHDLEHTDAM